MLSKLDILCLDRKRDSRRASFLIRDILEEGDDEEDIIVTEDEEYAPSQLDRRPPSSHHVTQVPTSLISLPQGALWDPHLGVTYPVGAIGPPHVISNEEHAALLTGRGPTHQRTVCPGGLSFCCLNCPPQSWHAGFTELLAGGRTDVPPAAVPASVAAAAGVCVGLVPSAGVPVLGPGGGATASTAVSWSSCLGIARQDRTVDGLVSVGSKDGGSKSTSNSSGPPRKVRRNRTVFTELQLMGLERRFDCQKYLSTPDRAELARALGLTQLQVKTWYQNRRMKWKKQVMQGGCTVPPTKPKGRPKKNSIPSLNETQSRTCNADIASMKDAF